jgi:hypothetical protein
LEIEMHPVGPFIRLRDRGEAPDLEPETQDHSLAHVIKSLREARKILQEHNAKPMAIDKVETK